MTSATKAIVLDTETTGFDDGEVIELAWVGFASFVPEGVFLKRYNPTSRIKFDAIATHYIRKIDLVDKDPSANAAKDIPADCEYFIAHNVDFDWKMLGSPNVKRICTLAIARKVWPNADSHKLSSLFLQLNGEDDYFMESVKHAHNAMADVSMCVDILQKAIVSEATSNNRKLDDLESLWQFSEECRIPDVLNFGKHKGSRIEDVPRDYRQWLAKQSDVDPYLMMALKKAGI